MSRSDELTVYAARWVFPVSGPPLRDALVTVQNLGAGNSPKIVSVECPTNQVSSSPKFHGGLPVRHLGNVALLPGLINAHTHLEFSLLAAPLGTAGSSFSTWLREMIARRRDAAAQLAGHEALLLQQLQTALASGRDQSLAAGATALGEIVTPGLAQQSLPAILSQGNASLSHATLFLELLGLSAERVTPLLETARQHLQQTPARPGIVHGLSPHAPYTVHPELLRQACALSREFQAPVAMHLAESFEELELLRSHSGNLVELLQSLGAWQPTALPRGLRPRDYLETLAQAHRALVIHGNFLVDDEWNFLAEQRQKMTLVYCPRTQAYFAHGDYPLAEILAAGVRVAVGTDSRASNPDLSLFAELQFIATHHPQISPATVLQMGTQSGAEALGIDRTHGTLEPGKLAHFCVVQLPEDSFGSSNSLNENPYELLWQGTILTEHLGATTQ